MRKAGGINRYGQVHVRKVGGINRYGQGHVRKAEKNDIYSRGSYTLEASLVMSVLLVVLLLMLRMTWQQTDQVRMEAILAEKATLAAAQAALPGDLGLSMPEMYGGFFYLHLDSVKLKVSKKEAAASASEEFAGDRFGAAFTGKIKVPVRRPVHWIRIVRRSMELAGLE